MIMKRYTEGRSMSQASCYELTDHGATVTGMANRVEDSDELRPWSRRAPLFGERFPDYTHWLDGATWELDLIEDLHGEDLNRFRAALHYQAKEAGRQLVTKTVTRDGDRKVLLVRAE
jgi:hypothetical protein